MGKNNNQIVNPKVLFVNFERNGGYWTLSIPDAYGKGQDFRAPITENFSLQFQPVGMTNMLNGEKSTGVGCVPIVYEPAKGDTDEPLQTANN